MRKIEAAAAFKAKNHCHDSDKIKKAAIGGGTENKMKIKKLCAGVLVLAVSVSALFALAACRNGDSPAETTPAVDETTTAVETTEYLDGLNFNSAVRVLGWEAPRNEFYVDELTEDRVNDSIYLRNKTVEERIGVKFEFDLIKGDNPNKDFFVTQAEATVGSGACEYDVIGCYSMCSGIMAQRGLLCDLYTVDYLDMNRPWWPESLTRSSEINGKLYFATGDISNEFLYNLYFMLVNLDRLKELGLNDPRVMTENNTWTLDAMMEMCKRAYEDLNSSQKADYGDKFGLVIFTQVHIDSFLAASGVQMTRWDNNGNIVLSEDFTGERMVNIVDKLGSWINGNNEIAYDTNDGYKTIKSGNALFGTCAGSTVMGFRDIDWVYGILPFPMIDKDSGGYHTNVGFAYTNFSVPQNAPDKAMSGAAIEALAAESYTRTSPVLFEVVFKSVLSNDPLDARMYDIIKSNVYVDMARLYSGNFTWANSAVALFRNTVISGEKSWRVKVKANEAYINGVFAEISESFRR